MRWTSYLEEAALEHNQEAIAHAMVSSAKKMKLEDKDFLYDDEILAEWQDLIREWTAIAEGEVQEYLKDEAKKSRKEIEKIKCAGPEKAKKPKARGRPRKGRAKRTKAAPTSAGGRGQRPAPAKRTARPAAAAAKVPYAKAKRLPKKKTQPT